MNDNPSRRGATMIDRELPTRAHQARREPRIAAANGLLGQAGLPEACIIRRTDR